MVKSGICVNCGFPNKKTKGKNANPFSERGREKMSELMAEVEEKKQRILKSVGNDGILMLRFTYAENNGLKPIIVTEKRKRKKMTNRVEMLGHAAGDNTAEKRKDVTAEKKKKKMVKFNVPMAQVSHAYLAAAAVIFTLLLIVLLKRQVLCRNSRMAVPCIK